MSPNIVKQSTLFGRTSRSAPAGETSPNAQLLERAGFVRKFMAGVYLYLPLGWRVLNKIANVIREELNAIDSQEVFFSVLQPKELWDTTGRWESLAPVMYQFKDHSGKDVGLGFTHEEVMADTVRHHVNSYKDLPLALYQIQWKFRHELRAKSGLNRGREFLMKDLYSFHTSPEDCNVYYERVKEAYLRIFRRLGLEARVVEASGGAFTKEYSHEFQVFSEFGEDHILYCGSCSFAQNKEIATVKSGDACPACSNGVVEESRGVEVGNIFRLGTKYSEPLNALYVDADGNRKPIIMACYGIGVSRLMGTIIDIHHDDRGMLWPDEVAPFDVHVLCLGSDSSRLQQADELCEALAKAGFQVLLDDRQNSAGASLADADLLGIPVRLILSDKTKGSVEYKRRFEKTAQLLTSSEVLRHLMKDKESHAR